MKHVSGWIILTTVALRRVCAVASDAPLLLQIQKVRVLVCCEPLSHACWVCIWQEPSSSSLSQFSLLSSPIQPCSVLHNSSTLHLTLQTHHIPLTFLIPKLSGIFLHSSFLWVLYILLFQMTLSSACAVGTRDQDNRSSREVMMGTVCGRSNTNKRS